MAPQESYVVNNTTLGDTKHRDTYIRHKIQANESAPVENYYYNTLTDGESVTKTITAVEQVSLDSGYGTWKLFTKSNNSAALDITSDTAALTINSSQIATDRSLSVGSSLTVTGSSSFHDDANMNNKQLLNLSNLTGGANTKITMDDSNSKIDCKIGTSTILTIDSSGLTFSGNLTTVGGNGGNSFNSGLTVNGDVDLQNHRLVNVTDIVGGTHTTIAMDETNSKVNTMIGTSSILSVDASGITVNGNLNVVGTQSQTIIQSNTVQVGDKNIELGYEATSLSLIDGGGITLGKSGQGYSQPYLIYDNTLQGWKSNIDILASGSTYTAKLDCINGVFTAFDNNTPSQKTELNSNELVFSSTWKFMFNSTKGSMDLMYNSGTAETPVWVKKHSFSA